MAYIIDKEKCVGCGYCKFLCLLGAVEERRENDRDYYEIAADKCAGCGQCSDGCLVGCIYPAEGQRKIKRVYIDKEKCIGCTLCKRGCPADAIDGVVKQPFEIREDLCIKCGVCAEKCKMDAVVVEY